MTPPEEIETWAASDDVEDRRRAAEAHSAPASMLQAMATDEDETIRKAVARHPNTPLEAVLRLAEKHPAAVLENPARSVWSVEQPGFLSEASPEALAALLRQEMAPE